MNMTDIEQKALELVNRIAIQRDAHYTCADRANDSRREALCRALEAHDADRARHAAEMREQAEREERLGEALYGLSARIWLTGWHKDDANHAAYEKVVAAFGRPFILPAADPLYEALKAVVELGRYDTAEQTQLLRHELEARGLSIVAKED